MTITREDLLRTWDDAWKEGLWYAPWSKVLDDLTPEQVAWSPGPERHSIWQIIDHMLFWREVAMRRAAGQAVSEDEMQQRNFRPTPLPSAEMLDELHTRLAASHEQVRAAMMGASADLAKFERLAFHDSYHIGQVMYLRAMQGLKPIE